MWYFIKGDIKQFIFNIYTVVEVDRFTKKP